MIKAVVGDFCCQSIGRFFYDRAEPWFGEVDETTSEQKSRVSGATRVYAQFLHEEVPSQSNGCTGSVASGWQLR